MAKEGMLGMTPTVPEGMEPSSACACMSVLGYDPKTYYKGRAAIEAVSMGIPVSEGEAVFRCNLVAIKNGRMWSYCAGHISSEEAEKLVTDLNKELGDKNVHFYPGVGYRQLLKLKGCQDTLKAVCTPPHDIPNKKTDEHLPSGKGSAFLKKLMKDAETILREHPLNMAKVAHGQIPATDIWLFWGSGPIPDMPSFEKIYGVKGALTSGVDLLKGLGKMMAFEILDIPGVSDGPNNDYKAQVKGAIEALDENDLVVIHIEAPDEIAHTGDIDAKVKAIEQIDKEVVSRIVRYKDESLRVLVMPDHPTPIKIRTHIAEPVPFLLWGLGFTANGAGRFTEAEALETGFSIKPGFAIMNKLVT
jgi:2,3-bisphosphoglycerate-independent phosphoglycerate mutase